MENLVFLVINGDEIGEDLGGAIASDDSQSLSELSQKFNQAREAIDQHIQEIGGQVVISNGDEAVYQVPAESIDELVSQIKQSYQDASGKTLTMGSGETLSQAYKALIHGKESGKDQYNPYSQEMDSDEHEDLDENPEYDEIQDEDSQESPEISDEQEETPEMDEDSEEVPEESDESYEDEDMPDNVDPFQQDEGQESSEEAPEDSDDEWVDDDDSDYVQNVDDNFDSYNDESEAENDGEDYEDDEEEEIPDLDPSEIASHHRVDQEESPEMDEDSEEVPEESEDEGQDHQNLHDLLSHHLGQEQGQYPEDSEESSMEMQPQDESMDEIPQDESMDESPEEDQDTQELKAKIMQTLQQFKQNKGIIEQSKETDPEAYAATMNMLQAMIEMAKKLSISDNEELQDDEMPEEQSSETPEEIQAITQGQQSPKM